MGFKVKVSGFDAVAARCEAAARDLADEKAFAEDLRHAAQPVLDDWRAGIPRATGKTQDDLRMTDQPAAPGHVRIAIGGTTKKHGRAWLLYILEFGTSKLPALGAARQAWDRNKAQIVPRLAARLRTRLFGGGL